MTVKKDWTQIFLDRLSKTPNISAAARSAKVTRQAAYERKKQDPDFSAAWDEALVMALDDAEGEMYRRAVHGTTKPVYQGGQKVGAIKEYSDTLLIFMLKAHKPDMYRETVRSELTGKDGGPIQQSVQHDLSRLSVDELKTMRNLAVKAANVDS